MFQASEVFQLALAIVLSPLIIRSLTQSKLPARRNIATGLMSLTAAYVLTVVEGFAAEELMNALEHAAYAVAGVAFALSARTMSRFWSRQGGGST